MILVPGVSLEPPHPGSWAGAWISRENYVKTPWENVFLTVSFSIK